jgi:type VI protein secretion system component VasF
VSSKDSPLTALRLAYHLYREAAPLEPSPTRAQLVQELRELVEALKKRQVEHESFLAVVWALLRYLFEKRSL